MTSRYVTLCTAAFSMLAGSAFAESISFPGCQSPVNITAPDGFVLGRLDEETWSKTAYPSGVIKYINLHSLPYKPFIYGQPATVTFAVLENGDIGRLRYEKFADSLKATVNQELQKANFARFAEDIALKKMGSSIAVSVRDYGPNTVLATYAVSSEFIGNIYVAYNTTRLDLVGECAVVTKLSLPSSLSDEEVSRIFSGFTYQ